MLCRSWGAFNRSLCTSQGLSPDPPGLIRETILADGRELDKTPAPRGQGIRHMSSYCVISDSQWVARGMGIR